MKFKVLASAAGVKAEAARRIEAAYPIWRQINIMREGGAASDEMSTYVDNIRAASNRIEAMRPIPHDYRADHHWN